jgi:DNA-binding transcriptional MerR regulator
MFKIGDFSKLTRVPIKTLRHYDEIGLFKPLNVDRFSSYRYYSFDQLPRLNRILAFKDLGFSLGQIARLLDKNLSADEIEGMLRLRRAELEQQVEVVSERLARVEVRLSQIKREGKMAENEIVLKKVEAVKIISAREVVPTPEQMRQRCIALMDEVCAVMEAQKIQSDGVTLALYHDHNDAGIDVEMAVFVDAATPDQQHGRVKVYALPAMETMATAVYRGSYDAFAAVGQLHADVGRWIESNGYRINGPNREIYLKTPDKPGGDGVMEIQFPVTKAG